MRRTLWNLAGTAAGFANHIENRMPRKSGTIALFDPSIATENMGDEIIMNSCCRVLSRLFPESRFLHIGTHTLPAPEDIPQVRGAEYRFVCGTNLLTSHIEHSWRWVLPEGFRGKWPYRNGILLGVGWGEYQDACSDYSKLIYRCMLNPDVLHSVRDQYTAEILREAGFDNVINTGCPTTWALTPEFCRTIPTRKGKNVVTTVTEYRPDPLRDQEMLNILSRSYETVYLWPQGSRDEAYLNHLELPSNLRVIPGNLESFSVVLKSDDVDYVGTRLHGGIYALNHGVRSIIISVDNRAAEMGRDIYLPVLAREELGTKLEGMIHGELPCGIRIRQDNIRKFLTQFEKWE